MATKRNYIGLATTPHDSALAIVNNLGQVVFAEATERYIQNKRAINVVPDLLQRTAALIDEYCDPEAEIIAAYSWSAEKDQINRQLLKTIDESYGLTKSAFESMPAFSKIPMATSRFLVLSHLRMSQLSGQGLAFELRRLGREVINRRYPHHLAHAALACFSSPLDEAVCAIVDDYYEDAACTFYAYKGGKLIKLSGGSHVGASELVGSQSFFYREICETCEFDWLGGDESEVMDLAPYGAFDSELYRLLRSLLRVEDLSIAPVSQRRQFEVWRELYRIRRSKEERTRTAANIACTAQKVFTEALYELLNNLYVRRISQHLAFGGSCALNSSVNGGILDHTPYGSLFVGCAPADDGNAIGAALLAYQEDHPEWRPTAQLQSPYMGTQMSNGSLEHLKRFSGIKKLTVCVGDAPDRAARLLSEGKIIGWIQGRAEFGPVALGNRSILADPRSLQVKKRLNETVKFRGEFQPFALSILPDFGPLYFERYQESPYMERTLGFKKQMLDYVPGVVHEGGTGRLQTVRREWNERYHQLIHRFYELTGVPLVLNTSFNVVGKPISHSVEDVIAVFYTSGLDALFIDDLMIEK